MYIIIRLDPTDLKLSSRGKNIDKITLSDFVPSLHVDAASEVTYTDFLHTVFLKYQNVATRPLPTKVKRKRKS